MELGPGAVAATSVPPRAGQPRVEARAPAAKEQRVGVAPLCMSSLRSHTRDMCISTELALLAGADSLRSSVAD